MDARGGLLCLLRWLPLRRLAPPIPHNTPTIPVPSLARQPEEHAPRSMAVAATSRFSLAGEPGLGLLLSGLVQPHAAGRTGPMTTGSLARIGCARRLNRLAENPAADRDDCADRKECRVCMGQSGRRAMRSAGILSGRAVVILALFGAAAWDAGLTNPAQAQMSFRRPLCFPRGPAATRDAPASPEAGEGVSDETVERPSDETVETPSDETGASGGFRFRRVGHYALISD